MIKTTLTLCSCMFTLTVAAGQTVNGIPIADIDARFIEITGQPAALFNSRQTVNIDFGQAAHSLGADSRFEIRDKDGQPVVFKTMVGALNFMAAHGYRFVQAYVVRNGDLSACHYLMKKKHSRKQNERTEKTSPDI